MPDPAIVHGNTFRGLVLSPDATKYTRCYQFAAGQESIEHHNLTPVLMLNENFTFPLSKSLTEPAVNRSSLLQIPVRFTSIEMMVTTGNAYCDKATGDSLTQVPSSRSRLPSSMGTWITQEQAYSNEFRALHAEVAWVYSYELPAALAGPELLITPPEVNDFWKALSPIQRRAWKVNTWIAFEGKSGGSCLMDEAMASDELVRLGLAQADLLIEAR